jgi:hypothetical protein
MKKLMTGKMTALRPANLVLAFLLAGSVEFLCSCATDSEPAAQAAPAMQAGPAAQSQPAPDEGVFKFSVLLYRQPVLVDGWKFDPTQSDNPEGAALNLIALMREGNVDRWLASWESAERPKLSKEERAALLQKWQPLKDGQVYLLGRVVAETKIIIEASVVNPGQPDLILKFPLDRSNDQWWMTQMDPGSEYLNWENSPNKTVEKMRTDILKRYLEHEKLGK